MSYPGTLVFSGVYCQVLDVSLLMNFKWMWGAFGTICYQGLDDLVLTVLGEGCGQFEPWRQQFRSLGWVTRSRSERRNRRCNKIRELVRNCPQWTRQVRKLKKDEASGWKHLPSLWDRTLTLNPGWTTTYHLIRNNKHALFHVARSYSPRPRLLLSELCAFIWGVKTTRN